MSDRGDREDDIVDWLEGRTEGSSPGIPDESSDAWEGLVPEGEELPRPDGSADPVDDSIVDELETPDFFDSKPDIEPAAFAAPAEPSLEDVGGSSEVVPQPEADAYADALEVETTEAGANSEESPFPAEDVADAGVNITLPNDAVATVTQREGMDPDVRIAAASRNDDDLVGVVPTTTERGCLPGVSRAVMVVGAVVLVGILGFGGAKLGLFGGGDESSAPSTVAAVTAQSDTEAPSEATGTSVAVDVQDAGTCEPATPGLMTLQSPEATDGSLGSEWLRMSLRDRGWPTPELVISGMPLNATEFAIVASELNDRAFNEWTEDPSADPRTFHSFYLMLATGIPPETVRILSTSSQDGESDMTFQLEHMLSPFTGAFLGTDTPGHVLFTVVALCDPPGDYWDPANLVWMEGRIADASVLLHIG